MRTWTALRLVVLGIAALEFAPVCWLVVQSDLLGMDWSRSRNLELLWIPALFGVPSGLALLLASVGRGLGWAIGFCVFYALLAFFFLSIARVATVAG